MIILRCNWNLDYYWRPDGVARDDAWQAYRERIFKQYTLASLQRQTHDDWQVWLRCDITHMPTTELMRCRLGDNRVRTLYHIHSWAMEKAKELWANQERVIFGRIDSDDMLHPEALARLAQETEPGLVQFGFGYALDLTTGRLYEWNHPSSPFIAEIDALDTMRYGMPELGGNHGRVHRYARRIDDRRWYMVTVHGDNVCNRLPSRWSGAEIDGTERDRVLAEFGVTEPRLDILTTT